MNRQQKIAWFNLIVIAICIVVTSGMVTKYAFQHGFPSAFGGTGFLGFACLIALGPVFFKKKKGQVSLDERDVMIERRAVRCGTTASYFYFVIVCIVTWLVVGVDSKISAGVLPMLVVGGFLVVNIVQSITTLVDYGRGSKGE
ncbi:hypothetical protein ACFL1G_10650 [Planctomycetota bacterium]